jgi:4-hydroxy-tetrahydrodipicolinate synthase
VAIVDGRIPVYAGVGGNSTHKVTQMIRRLERFRFDGILTVCPHYNRPSEEGVREHFRQIANSTDRPILLYNIPYRTGVNLSNDSVLELSKIPNIKGIKDSCANLAQTVELLRRKPPAFSVMAGEDAMFYTTLALGGDGGILASAHFEPSKFVQIFERIAANDHQRARSLWHTVEPAIRLFFKESNPLPIKHCSGAEA